MKIILEGSAAEILDMIYEIQSRILKEIKVDYDKFNLYGAVRQAIQNSSKRTTEIFKKMAREGKLGYQENFGDSKRNDNKDDNTDNSQFLVGDMVGRGHRQKKSDCNIEYVERSTSKSNGNVPHIVERERLSAAIQKINEYFLKLPNSLSAYVKNMTLSELIDIMEKSNF